MQYEKYMTITLFACDGKGNLYYAGLHQDILIFRQGQKYAERIATDGMWVGLIDDIRPHIANHKLDVAVGDIILLFTDGLTESFYDTGGRDDEVKKIDNMYGVPQLQRHFERLARQGNSPKGIIEGLLPTLQPYRVFDDLTLLILQRK
jgi:serine phosphatase RsbU (regulator of sigma subunit)